MFEPDDFRADPYGHWTNQTSHALQVGMLGFVWTVAAAYHWLVGHFPVKEHMVVFALVAYLTYELLDQGWQGWDTINDTRFVVGWGVAAPLVVFDEMSPGSPLFVGNIYVAAPLVAGFVLDLAIGSWMRARRRRKEARAVARGDNPC